MQTPWKVILAFVGVFVAGAVFGGLLALRLGRVIIGNRPEIMAPARGEKVTGREADGPAAATPPGGPQAVQRAQLMRRVTNHLDLSPVQRERIGPIIDRGLQDFWRVQQNFSRENVFLLQRLKLDIAKELQPEQQRRLDELWQKQMDGLRRKQQEAQAQRQAAGRAGPAEATVAKPTPVETAKPASDSPAKAAPGGGK